jgi:GntR family transcriptional regulator
MMMSRGRVNTSNDAVGTSGSLRRGPVPLHHQVYLQLSASLDAGRWQPADRLPTERELAAGFGCSLITVRRALDELRRERRIERKPGRGTFVTSPPLERDLTALTSFTDEMRSRGLDPQTRLVRTATQPAEAMVAAALGIEPGAPVLFIERVRSVSGQPLMLEQAYLPSERFPDLPTADLERGSLYQALADRYGLRPVRADETVEPVLPSAREARLLEQPPHRPALLIELIACAEDGSPIEYCRAIVRGDRARYRVDASGSRLDAVKPGIPQVPEQGGGR